MKYLLLGGALLASGALSAKEATLLSDADATALQGKSVAITMHARPSFSAMTAGKATFGLFGAAAMISAGNKLVDENHVADPAITIRDALAGNLHDVYGALPRPVDGNATEAKKPKELAALHPDADYVLDVRSGGWMYAYFPSKWGKYWVNYGVEVQLIDTKSARLLASGACKANTRENANPPTREELEGDNAKLLKSVTQNLGWSCVQLLAKNEFHVPADKVPAIPEEYVDPLAHRTPLPEAPAANAANTQDTAPAAAAPAGDAGAAAAPSKGEGSH